MDSAGSYDHTQRGWIHILLVIVALAMAGGSWAAHADGETVAAWGLGVGGVVMAGLSWGFAHLRVHHDGDGLRLAFGPLPLFRRRVRYADITSAARGRSKTIDGWGIHWVPGRGWTWNLAGYDCVELETTGGGLRIGTDDPDGLEAWDPVPDRRVDTMDAASEMAGPGRPVRDCLGRR